MIRIHHTEKGVTIPVASFTRKAIREAFLQLLDERMLSEITVKDIVERCGINRNSFYYHYRDLPALIEEIVQEEADAVIAGHASLHDMVDCFDAVVSFVTHRKRAILHIFRSVNRDVFERYLMKTCRYFVDTYLTAALLGDPVDPKAHAKELEEMFAPREPDPQVELMKRLIAEAAKISMETVWPEVEKQGGA